MNMTKNKKHNQDDASLSIQWTRLDWYKGVLNSDQKIIMNNARESTSLDTNKKDLSSISSQNRNEQMKFSKAVQGLVSRINSR